MGKLITFGRADGEKCNGYYTELNAEAPGIVVIQEWWGLNDQIKGVADRLTAAGFRTLVPDLYRGKVTLEAAEAEHLMSRLDFGDAAAQDIGGAVRYLKARSKKVAVMGFCMGGALTILAAVRVGELDAAVCWYGIPPETAADTKTIRIPIQCHFALGDSFFPPAQVDALRARFREGNVPHEIFSYQAKHAFGNETGENYNPEAAKFAWERSLEFLRKHIVYT